MGSVAPSGRADCPDDLLHWRGDVPIDDAIPQARLQPVGRDQLVVGVEVLDDRGRFRERQVGSGVAQHRDACQGQLGVTRTGVFAVDDLGLEGHIELVERDQDLLAIPGERVLVQDEGHGVNGPTRPLPAGALAVLAPRPAAGPALAFLQLLLGPPNAALSGGRLLGILDPADELVAGQGRDVLPGIECRGVGDQRLAQVRGQLVHHPTGHSSGRSQAHGSHAERIIDANIYVQKQVTDEGRSPVNVQFIATVAVIAADPAASRRLYVDALGLPLQSQE